MWNFNFPFATEKSEHVFQPPPFRGFLTRELLYFSLFLAHGRSLLLTLTCQLSSVTALQRRCSTDLNLPAPTPPKNTPCYHFPMNCCVRHPLLSCIWDHFGSFLISCAGLTHTPRLRSKSLAVHVWSTRREADGVHLKRQEWRGKKKKEQQEVMRWCAAKQAERQKQIYPV